MIHLKLDELLRAVKHARTNFAELNNLSDEDLARYEREFLDLCAQEKQQRQIRSTHAAHARAHAGGQPPIPVEPTPETK